MIINPYLKRSPFYFILPEGKRVHGEDIEQLAEYMGKGEQSVALNGGVKEQREGRHLLPRPG